MGQVWIDDPRGQLFFEYIRILKYIKPRFFVAENVNGMLSKRHTRAVTNILKLFDEAGYDVEIHSANAADYGVPQERKRIFYIGFRKDLHVLYRFPQPIEDRVDLFRAIKDLEETAIPSISGRQCQLHPSAPKMIKTGKDKYAFADGYTYRRLTVRECTRLQTFPDNFKFYYDNINDGYKMVGNAVPVLLAFDVAYSIHEALDYASKNPTEYEKYYVFDDLEKANE